MTAAALLVKLWSAGIELSAAGDQLRCRAAAGMLTPKVVAAIQAAKAELLSLLEAEELAQYGLRRCPVCRRIQAVRWFLERGDRCDECRSDGEQTGLFEG